MKLPQSYIQTGLVLKKTLGGSQRKDGAGSYIQPLVRLKEVRLNIVKLKGVISLLRTRRRGS